MDEDLLRSIMIEVAEFLMDIEQINEPVLQRITHIALRHLNTSINKTAINLNKYLISHDEFLRNLHNFDRRNRDIFMEGLESYLSTIFVTSVSQGSMTNACTNGHMDEHLFHQHQHRSQIQRQPDCYLDLTPSSSMCKSNEMLSSLRKKDEATAQNAITLADVVAVIGQHVVQMDNDNEDLAEADQICNSEDIYSTEDDFNNGGGARCDSGAEVAGAIGGISLSTLPDLAKVTATPSTNALEVSKHV